MLCWKMRRLLCLCSCFITRSLCGAQLTDDSPPVPSLAFSTEFDNHVVENLTLTLKCLFSGLNWTSVELVRGDGITYKYMAETGADAAITSRGKANLLVNGLEFVIDAAQEADLSVWTCRINNGASGSVQLREPIQLKQLDGMSFQSQPIEHELTNVFSAACDGEFVSGQVTKVRSVDHIPHRITFMDTSGRRVQCASATLNENSRTCTIPVSRAYNYTAVITLFGVKAQTSIWRQCADFIANVSVTPNCGHHFVPGPTPWRLTCSYAGLAIQDSLMWIQIQHPKGILVYQYMADSSVNKSLPLARRSNLYEWKSQVDSGSITVAVDNFQPEDLGEWSCHVLATPSQSIINSTVTISESNIAEPPPPEDVSIVLSCTPGFTVMAECSLVNFTDVQPMFLSIEGTTCTETRPTTRCSTSLPETIDQTVTCNVCGTERMMSGQTRYCDGFKFKASTYSASPPSVARADISACAVRTHDLWIWATMTSLHAVQAFYLLKK